MQSEHDRSEGNILKKVNQKDIVDGTYIIPKNIIAIGDIAFYDCVNLTSIQISGSVTSIGEASFYGCTNLTNIQILDSVTSIKAHAFSGCTNLSSIQISDSVTSIGEGAFVGCANLTNIQILGSVTSIRASTFSACTNLTNIQIPDSVTSIEGYAFYDCANLASIQIPGSVTSIGEYAFYGCANLTSIQIPGNVTSIGKYAFSGCVNLTSIQIPGSVTSIGEDVFWDCAKLELIVVSDEQEKDRIIKLLPDNLKDKIKIVVQSLYDKILAIRAEATIDSLQNKPEINTLFQAFYGEDQGTIAKLIHELPQEIFGHISYWEGDDNEFMKDVRIQINQLSFPDDSKMSLDKYREDINLIIKRKYESMKKVVVYLRFFPKEQPLDEKDNSEGQEVSRIKLT